MGVRVLKGRLPRTKNLILISINSVPAARLAPDKDTWYSLTNLGIFKRPLKHSFRGYFPECLCVQITMLDRQAFFISPSFLHSSPSRFSHPIHSLHGTQSYILPLPPGNGWKAARLQRQLLLGQKAALVKAKANLISPADKQPTSHFTFVVTYLFRQAAVEGSFRHCLASL